MVIVHIASIANNMLSGVSVAAPSHAVAQSIYADVAFINIKGEILDLLQNSMVKQIEMPPSFDLSEVEEPFNNPDIVVFHECYRVEYLKIAKVLREKNIPYILIPHGELRNEAQHKKWAKKKVANFLLFNTFIENALAVQCLSLSEIEATKFGKRKFVGTNGVHLPQIYKTSFSSDSIKFLYIGRYEWRVKGLDILFQAIRKQYKLLKQTNSVFELYGPDTHGRLQEIRALVRENKIEDIIRLNTEIIGTKKENKLLEANVFVQCSRHEGMPMGILEAMSYGIPCLVTKGTTLSELIQSYDAGWGVETSIEGISNGIRDVLMHKSDIEKKGKNARNLILEHFDWKNIAQETIGFYRDLLKK